jgi:hypothetical protein
VRVVTEPALTTSRTTAARGSEQGDPLIRALARYVEALHHRYPDGPKQMRREGLDGRAKVSQMVAIQKGPAA